MTWDGKERRNGLSDHDLLQQIANDVKHIREWNSGHQKEDDERYKEHQSEHKNYNRVLWLGGGVLLAFQVILKLFH